MINHLKEQVILKAGHGIKNRGDCENLSRLTEIETGDYLNYSTLRRFFGIDPKKVKPRSATLNILSKYLGYRSFGHLSAFHPEKPFFLIKIKKTDELLSDFYPIFFSSLLRTAKLQQCLMGHWKKHGRVGQLHIYPIYFHELLFYMKCENL